MTHIIFWTLYDTIVKPLTVTWDLEVSNYGIGLNKKWNEVIFLQTLFSQNVLTDNAHILRVVAVVGSIWFSGYTQEIKQEYAHLFCRKL